MGVRVWAFNNLNIQIPSSKPLNTPPNDTLDLVSAQRKRAEIFSNMVTLDKIVDLKGRVLISDVPKLIDEKVSSMIKNKMRYEFLAHKFPNPIKWYHIAFIHELECSQNFNCYLGNGQVWFIKTTIVPKGRGPFKSFEDGAIDAIRFKKLNLVNDWGIGNTLYILEGYNGYGYSKWHNTNSPYLFSGTNAYTSGRYIADHVYDPKTVSQQIGIAPLMKALFQKENIQVS